MYKLGVLSDSLKLFLQKHLLEEPGVDGRIIQKWISRSGMGGGMEWIDLAEVMARWRAYGMR